MLSLTRYGILFLFLVSFFLLLEGCSSSGNTVQDENLAPASDIKHKRNVNRVRIQKVGTDDNRVEVRFVAGRGQITAISGPVDVFLQGSSGDQHYSNFRGHENINFPFRGVIDFKYIKQKYDSFGSTGGSTSAAVTVKARVEYTLSEPGKWIITVYY